MAKPRLQIIIGSTRPGRVRFTANEALDNSAVAMLSQLSRWTARLGSIR